MWRAEPGWDGEGNLGVEGRRMQCLLSHLAMRAMHSKEHLLEQLTVEPGLSHCLFFFFFFFAVKAGTFHDGL